jgi:hypothetical protein
MATATRSRTAEEGSQAGYEAGDLASDAGEDGGALAQVAKDDARQVAASVRERASEVTEQLSAQGRSLLDDARYQVRNQAQAGTQRVAGALRRIGEEAQALAEGRPDEASALSEYVWRVADGAYGAADRIHAIAEDVEERGLSGVLDDVQDFARRRPGAFLLGAALLGFGVGRLVKAERQRSDDEEYDEHEEYDEYATGPESRVRARAAR